MQWMYNRSCCHCVHVPGRTNCSSPNLLSGHGACAGKVVLPFPLVTYGSASNSTYRSSVLVPNPHFLSLSHSFSVDRRVKRGIPIQIGFEPCRLSQLDVQLSHVINRRQGFEHEQFRRRAILYYKAALSRDCVRSEADYLGSTAFGVEVAFISSLRLIHLYYPPETLFLNLISYSPQTFSVGQSTSSTSVTASRLTSPKIIYVDT